MKPFKTRPVLSMNFYEQPRQSIVKAQQVHKGNNIQFGVQPYKKMIEQAQYQAYCRDIRKKQFVEAKVKDIQEILEVLLVDGDGQGQGQGQGEMETTGKFNGFEKQNQASKINYHSDKQYFKNIKKKLQKINKIIDTIND